MKRWLISNNQIAGWVDQHTQASAIPNGFKVVEGPDVHAQTIYYDSATQSIVEKPPQPSAAHYWDGELNSWVFVEEIAIALDVL